MSSTPNLGNAPNIPVSELLAMRGKVCAVELGSRNLLGVGDSWEQAVSMLEANGHAGKEFYRYVVAKTFRREDVLKGLGKVEADSAR